MRTFKQALKARESSSLPLQHRLASFLFGYCATPHTTTGCSPSALFLGWELRTHMDLLRPNCEDHVIAQQSNQVQHHDQHAKLRQFQVGQHVMARNNGPGPGGGVLLWSSHVLALSLCWLRPTSLRHGSVVMINCAPPMWQHTRPWILLMMSWCWITPSHHCLLQCPLTHHQICLTIPQGIGNHQNVLAILCVLDSGTSACYY